MKLLFRQRIFSWFDSYDIYDEYGNTVYVVKGQLAWGHCLKICDPQGHELGLVKEKIITLLPKFELYEGGRYIGRISKKLSLFSPKFSIDFNGWTVEGNFLEWDYTIRDAWGNRVATIGKELFHLSDTYVMDINDPADALHVLMFALAMDAEKCSREKK
ncbi:LURP-one-related/scramblase family protein [Acidaminococcus sp. HCP3S3_G9_1]|uniref:LURP-one-related/scramblase family protein n=1 Tax=Acidaminococcus sp. HCP3S3_G9_1 TaxID=3438732 RepID=UPI003F8E9436